MTRRWAALSGAVLLVGVAACGSDQPDSVARPSTSTAIEATTIPGLTAILEQYREDEIKHQLSVQITNASSSRIEVSDLQLQWAGLLPVAPFEKEYPISPGLRVDLPVNFGLAVCDDPPSGREVTPDVPAVAIAHGVVDGTGPPRAIAIPIEDTGRILDKVFRQDCQTQRLARAATLAWGTEWVPGTTPDGRPAATGVLTITRNVGTEPLTITRVNGSVLMRFETASTEPVLVLGPDEQSAVIPVTAVQSGNCDPHALIESKKTFIILVDLAIGDSEPVGDTVTFDNASRPVLNEMINASCGVG
jgi:hypothetical protein